MDKSSKDALSVDISSTKRILIKATIENFNANAEVCAINWFNLKRPWLYSLYSLLAYKFVVKASGKLYFKGKLINKLEGSHSGQRDNLLIVSYPTAKHFLKLVRYKLFQLFSLLRLAAVKQFCFGFTENIIQQMVIKNPTNPHFTKQQLYLVHHFQGNSDWLRENKLSLLSSAKQHQLSCYFCGLTTANLVREQSGKQQTADFFMDGILLFSANSRENIESFISSDLYQVFKKQNSENSLSIFLRSY